MHNILSVQVIVIGAGIAGLTAAWQLKQSGIQVLVLEGEQIVGATFYEKIFKTKPVASFPTYVAFNFANGLTVSLWSTQAKNFISGGQGHRSELAFMVPNEDQVRALRNAWKELGVQIEQDLHEAVFGLTFVALDPDGHRIRVCMPDKDK